MKVFITYLSLIQFESFFINYFYTSKEGPLLKLYVHVFHILPHHFSFCSQPKVPFLKHKNTFLVKMVLGISDKQDAFQWITLNYFDFNFAKMNNLFYFVNADNSPKSYKGKQFFDSSYQ